MKFFENWKNDQLRLRFREKVDNQYESAFDDLVTRLLGHKDMPQAYANEFRRLFQAVADAKFTDGVTDPADFDKALDENFRFKARLHFQLAILTAPGFISYIDNLNKKK